MVIFDCKNFNIEKPFQKRVVIVGSESEIKRVENIITEAEIKPLIIGKVAPSNQVQSDYHFGSVNQLEEIIQIHKTLETYLESLLE